MIKLKKQIILYFIICAFGSAILDSIIESVFDDVLMPMTSSSAKMTGLFLVLHFLITILIFLFFAFIFYQLMNKAINKESNRQVNERNMHYACITHDLKTPMTSVQGFAAALRDGKVKPEEQKDIYDIIYNKSCYMSDLLDTMFTYSKLNSEDYKLSCKEMDICSLIRDNVAMHYDEFEQKNMDLQLEIPEEEILCEIDEKEIKRVISNLLLNACNHNVSGSKILIKLEKQKASAVITVADNGRVFTDEERKKIFEPFQKSDEARSSGKGNGLGLAISRLIVEKHGGRLEIKEMIDEYSKGFVMTLMPSKVKMNQ